MDYTLRKLKNGLRVVVVPMRNSETVTVTTLIQTGTNNETRQNNGVSHFLEHMFFKGTKNYPSAKIQNERLDKIGAMHNAFTSYDETGYYVKVHKKHLKTAVDFFGDALQHALLKETEINKERGVIIEEMRMVKDDPARHIWDVFAGNIFGDQPFGWEIIGTTETLTKMNRKILATYWKSQYVPSNMVLAIAGNVDIEEAFSYAEKAFAGMKDKKAKPQATFKKPKTGPRVEITEKATDQTHLIFGFPGVKYGDAKQSVADVLATILGGSMSARLWRKIREQRGLAYTVSAGNEAFKKCAAFSIYVGCPAAAVPEVVKIIVAELAAVARKGVTGSELKLAKEKMRGKQAMQLEATNNAALQFAYPILYTNNVRTPDEQMKAIDAVTSKDIQEFAKKACKQKNYYLSLIGSGLDKDELLHVIKKHG